MNMSFYTAAVGAAQQQNRINVQANNIANVNTYGYKAERPAFATLMYGNVAGIDDARLPRGTGARMVMAGHDFSAASLADTGRPQDYAIAGRGFFALYDPRNGEVSYTRDGSFILSDYPYTDPEGQEARAFFLSDGDGRFVLDAQGEPIPVAQGDSGARQNVGVFDFISTDGMLAAGSGRFLPVEKNGPAQPVEALVRQGFLEASNTDLGYELTKVIEAQRSFSYALRMVQTSDEVESTINGLNG